MLLAVSHSIPETEHRHLFISLACESAEREVMDRSGAGYEGP